MNKLGGEIERWDRGIRWKRTFPEFDYHLMVDDAFPYTDETATAIEQVFLEFGKETRRLSLIGANIRKYKDVNVRKTYTAAEARDYRVDWKTHYDAYRARCRAVCPNEQSLANILVRLGYEKYPARDKRFMWNMAAEGIIKNIKQVDTITLPKRDIEGTHEYLGKRYSMVDVTADDLRVMEEDD
jgi:hypothetical protein